MEFVFGNWENELDGIDFESEHNQKLVQLLERGKYQKFVAKIQEEKLDKKIARQFCEKAMDAPVEVMDAICQQLDLEEDSVLPLRLVGDMRAKQFYMGLVDDFVAAERLDWLDWVVQRMEVLCHEMNEPLDSLWKAAMDQEKAQCMEFLLKRTPLEGGCTGRLYSETNLWAKQGMSPEVDACLEVLQRYKPCFGWEEYGYNASLTVENLLEVRNFPLLHRYLEDHELTPGDWRDIVQEMAWDWWSPHLAWHGIEGLDPLDWLDVLDKLIQREPKALRKKYVRGLVTALRLDGEQGNDPRIVRWVEQLGGEKIYLTTTRFNWCEPGQGLDLWEERMPKKLCPAMDCDNVEDWLGRIGDEDRIEALLGRCWVARSRLKHHVSDLAKWILNRGSSQLFMRHIESDGILYAEAREALMEYSHRDYLHLSRSRLVALETMGQEGERFAL